MKHILIVAIALIVPILATSQKWEGGVFFGGSSYQGDLIAPMIDLKETHIAYGLAIRYNINPHWAIRSNLLFGKITGDDSNYDAPNWRQIRGFNFQSSISEFSLLAEWAPLRRAWFDQNGFFQKGWSPYVFAGIGGLFFDPNTDFNEGSSMANQMASRIQDDKTAQYSNFGFSIPFGLGIKVDVSSRATLSLEGGIRSTFTDYLDGISVAANPDKYDWYGFGGLALTFRLGKTSPHKKNDIDGDGVLDTEDICPMTPGKALFGGCPDTDNDGIADKDDGCPTIAGLLNGCPDIDNDGIADKDDACPTVKGIAAKQGCPALNEDTDGDGVPNTEDRCPNTRGARMFDGCPDTDGDGIEDALDQCIRERGPAMLNGCPDTDGDGISDRIDQCPNNAGVASNKGCPLLKSEDKATLDFAIQNISFDTAGSTLTVGSYVILEEIAAILKRTPNYNLRIHGHTDSTGDSTINLGLSKERAKACHDYLIKKGVAPNRLSYRGHGESRPVADNETELGRRKNRRVEFEVLLP